MVPSSTLDVLASLRVDVLEAIDNLQTAKIAQAASANKSRGDEPKFRAGDLVMLSTENRRRDYKSRGEFRCAKLMPRYDGPYKVIHAHPECSTYTLDLPNNPNTFPTFHASLLKAHYPNDSFLFPTRELERPDGVLVNGVEEFLVDRIVDARRAGTGWRYKVRFVSYGQEEDRWLAHSLLQDNACLDAWEQRFKDTDGFSSHNNRR